jgi:hypothetical protein
LGLFGHLERKPIASEGILNRLIDGGIYMFVKTFMLPLLRASTVFQRLHAAMVNMLPLTGGSFVFWDLGEKYGDY